MFGQNTTTSQPAFGFGASSQPNTLFGATSTAPTATFGAASSSVPTNSVNAPTFGANAATTTTTTTPTFGGFGNTNTANNTTTTNSTFGFGNTNTSTTTNPTFGFGNNTNNAPTTSTPAFGFGNTSTATSTPSFGFGNTSAAPTTTPAFGNTSTATSSAPLFGAPATSAAATNTLFGASTTSTPATNTLFGASTSSAPATNTLFGGSSTTNPTSNTTSSTSFGFGSSTNANTTTTTTQPQEQQPHFLDLQHCFPDTNMASYIVKPDSITRSTDLVNQLFGGNASRSFTQQQKALKSNLRDSLVFNEKPVVLPLFLSATDSNHSSTNNKSNSDSLLGKKRLLEDDKTITGREKSHKGVFSDSNSLTDGFNKNLKKLENADYLPKESVNDIGMNPTSYKGKENKMATDDMDIHVSTEKQSLDGLTTKTRVRVFGFDLDKTQEIITFFTKLGELSEPYASQGNWITFNYVSPDAALKAMSYNGMSIDKDHMVGVTWDERAKEVHVLQTNDKPMDLFKHNGGLFLDRRPQQPKSQPQQQQQIQQQHQDTSILNRLREKLMGW